MGTHNASYKTTTLEAFSGWTERLDYTLEMVGVSGGAIFETPHNNNTWISSA